MVCREAEQESVETGTKSVTKAILFSQFTAALDMLEHQLTENGYCFMRLDGRMTITQRADAVRAFGKDPSVSLQHTSAPPAGSRGLVPL